MEYKPKYLEGTVTIVLPKIEADPAVWESYDPEVMAKNFAAQLKNNLLEYIVDPYEDDLLTVNTSVEISDTKD